MKPGFALVGAVVCLVAVAALAQSDTNRLHGMRVTLLSGAHQFMDPDTKTVLHGYVVKKPAQMATTMQPTDIVEFHVCNTDRVLPLQWGRLKDGPPCRTFAPPVWEAWKLQDGQLVAESLPGLAGSVSIDALPDNLQALLRSAAPANEVRAFSFPTPDGKMTLGIISKPGYVGG